MRFPAAITVALIATCALMSPARADVSVTFVNSYYYTAVQQDKRQAVLDDLRKTLEELGAQLASGNDLKVEVFAYVPMDVTTAKGAIKPTQMDIQYTLRQGGKPIMHDRETISDITYVDSAAAGDAKSGDPKGGEAKSGGAKGGEAKGGEAKGKRGEAKGEGGAKKDDPIAPEKAMLRDWFMQRFAAYIIPTAQ